MTDIEKQNRLIADFMGWNLVPETTRQYQVPAFFPHGDYKAWTILGPEEMEFHRSWDWIAKVVIKITELKAGIPFDRLHEIRVHASRFDMENIYDAIIKWINCYNSTLK